MNTDTLSLRYQGQAVDDGQIDAYSLAGSMVAFCDFLGFAAAETYGDTAKLQTRVSAFRKGSFLTDFSLQVGGVLATLFAGVASPKDLLDTIKSAFEVWHMLAGKEPVNIESLPNQQYQITGQSGAQIIINHGTFNLVTNEQAAQAARRFTTDRLDDGIERVSIEHAGETLLDADASRTGCYVPVLAAKPMTSNTMQIWLQLEAPNFKEGNKWKLSDDRGSFYAAIEDLDFLREIDEGKRFGKGDRLKVQLKIVQSQIGTEIKTERFVLKVDDHLPPARQTQLF